MARWIVYTAPLLLGILALSATVIEGVDGYGQNGEGNDKGDVRSIAAKDTDSKSKSNTRTITGRRRKKNRKKPKHKTHYDAPTSESRSNTRRTPYKGTGGLGPGTWVMAFQAGRVYKGKSYFNTSRYINNPDKMPTICEHRNLSYDDSDNSTNVFLFYCPGDDDAANHEYCCGDEGWEYCCAYEGPNIVLILGILSALVIVAVIIFGCCIWKRIHQKSELEKQPADQVVTANLDDPMLPPTIVTSPPPPQTVAAPPEEHVGIPPIDGNYGSYPQPGQSPPSDGVVPPELPPKDHLVISSSGTSSVQPPPQAV